MENEVWRTQENLNLSTIMFSTDSGEPESLFTVDTQTMLHCQWHALSYGKLTDSQFHVCVCTLIDKEYCGSYRYAL